MSKTKRFYTAGNGNTYPLVEAPYTYPVTVYKSDCKKAETGHPEQCLIALGALRDKAVEAVYIGSSKDAFVCFKATRLRKAYALHFTLNAKAQRVRDYFDTHRGITTQTITLSPPTAGRTLDHRSKLNKKRRAEIKNGAEVRKQETPRQTRIMRIGVAHRPKAQIAKNVVSMPPPRSEEAAA